MDESLLGFIVITFALLTLVVFVSFKSPRDAKKYFQKNRGVAKGVVIVIILIPLIAWLIDFAVKSAKAETTYFNNAYVYTGLDFGKKTLPNCHQGERDNITSNVGFGLNLLENKRTTVNAKYTHHSCAFYHDRLSYDAIGIEVKYKIPLK